MKAKILIVTDDAGESFEILYARHRFLEAGWQPVVAATRKKLLHGVIHDFEPGWTTYIEKPGYWIQADVALSKVKTSDYQAILLAGGRAPEYLRQDKHLMKIVREFNRQGKWILSICHGIQILISAGLVKGRKLTCYCNVRPELEQAGGSWVGAQCAVDGHIITAQTWDSHPDFYREIFKRLG